MTKTFRTLTLAALAGTLLSGYAFAQSTSTGAMSSSDHMTNGAMSSVSHGRMSSSGAMTPKKGHAMSGTTMKSKAHMKSDQMKMREKAKKKNGHMASGSMTNGH